MEEVVPPALDDRQELGHRRDLLALLLQEPVQELLPDELALLARELDELDDLVGDALLLLESERDRSDGVGETSVFGASTPGITTFSSASRRYWTIIIA